jgi:hypothetical protein
MEELFYPQHTIAAAHLMHRLAWGAYAMLRPMVKSGGQKKKGQEEPRRAMRARSVSDMLPEIGGAAFRRFGFVQSSIVSRWKEIVGDRYAAVSAPESIRFPPGRKSEGVLTLVVEGAHAPMMQHVAPVIMERVNRFFGYSAVSRISFKQGVVQLAKARTRVAPPSLRHSGLGCPPDGWMRVLEFPPISGIPCVKSRIRSFVRCWRHLRGASPQAKGASKT